MRSVRQLSPTGLPRISSPHPRNPRNDGQLCSNTVPVIALTGRIITLKYPNGVFVMIFDTTTLRFFWVYPQHFFTMVGLILVSTFYFVSLYKYSFDVETYTKIAILSSCGSLIAGKLVGCLNEYYIALVNQRSLNWDIIIFSGSALQGGLIGFLITFFIVSKKWLKKVEPQVLDIIAVGFPLYLFWARVTCFFSGCCYGIVSKNSFSMVYINRINGEVITERRIPITLVEAGLHLILFSVLWLLLKKHICKGNLMLCFLITYSSCRFFIEYFRADHYYFSYDGIVLNQIISTVIMTVSLLIIINKNLKINKE